MFGPQPGDVDDIVPVNPAEQEQFIRTLTAYFMCDSSGIGNSIVSNPAPGYLTVPGDGNVIGNSILQNPAGWASMVIDNDFTPPLRFSMLPSPSLDSPPLAEPVESAPAASPIARPEPERKMGTPQKRP